MLRREGEDRSAMTVECFPITVLPHVSQIYRDYLAMAESAGDAPVRRWYGAEPFAGGWLGEAAAGEHAGRLAGLLEGQAVGVWARGGPRADISELRVGGRGGGA